MISQSNDASDCTDSLPVVERETSHAPTEVPELPPFEGSGRLSIGWGRGNPDDSFTNYRGPVGRQTSNASRLPWAHILLGLPFLLVGGLSVWLALAFPRVEESDWGSAWIIGLACVFALGGMRVMIEPFIGLKGHQLRCRSPHFWQRDYPWRPVVHHETGIGHLRGAGHWFQSLLMMPVLVGLLIMIHLPLILAPEHLKGQMAVFGLPFELGAGTTKLLYIGVIGVFDFIALAAVGAMVYTLVQRWRFGRTSFRLETLPARTGDRLRVILELSRGVRANGPIQLTLYCIDGRLSGQSQELRDQKKSTLCVYRERRRLDATGRLITRLPMEFEIPAEVPGSQVSATPATVWRLVIRIPTRGPDYRGDFLVPVYSPDDGIEHSESSGA